MHLVPRAPGLQFNLTVQDSFRPSHSCARLCCTTWLLAAALPAVHSRPGPCQAPFSTPISASQHAVACCVQYASRPFSVGDRIQLITVEGDEVVEGVVVALQPTRTVIQRDTEGGSTFYINNGVSLEHWDSIPPCMLLGASGRAACMLLHPPSLPLLFQSCVRLITGKLGGEQF
jgi:hypothetical protein